MFPLDRLLRLTGLLLVLALSSGAGAEGGISGIPKPAAKDLCPVCGMIVSKYPNWVATVLYKDGHAHHFDGAKDMFKYLQDLQKYAPGHRKEDIQAIAVTDFYNLGKVDARQAWFDAQTAQKTAHLYRNTLIPQAQTRQPGHKSGGRVVAHHPDTGGLVGGVGRERGNRQGHGAIRRR